MTKESKEFKRRLKKMQKHIEALRGISEQWEAHNALDQIQEGLNDLEGHREEQERAQAGAAG